MIDEDEQTEANMLPVTITSLNDVPVDRRSEEWFFRRLEAVDFKLLMFSLHSDEIKWRRFSTILIKSCKQWPMRYQDAPMYEEVPEYATSNQRWVELTQAGHNAINDLQSRRTHVRDLKTFLELNTMQLLYDWHEDLQQGFIKVMEKPGTSPPEQPRGLLKLDPVQA